MMMGQRGPILASPAFSKCTLQQLISLFPLSLRGLCTISRFWTLLFDLYRCKLTNSVLNCELMCKAPSGRGCGEGLIEPRSALAGPSLPYPDVKTPIVAWNERAIPFLADFGTRAGKGCQRIRGEREIAHGRGPSLLLDGRFRSSHEP
jgi:hypothetical protein